MQCATQQKPDSIYYCGAHKKAPHTIICSAILYTMLFYDFAPIKNEAAARPVSFNTIVIAV